MQFAHYWGQYLYLIKKIGWSTPLLPYHQLQKVPYMLVVGEEEQSALAVSARKKGEGDIGKLSIADFANRVNEEVKQMLAEN